MERTTHDLKPRAGQVHKPKMWTEPASWRPLR